MPSLYDFRFQSYRPNSDFYVFFHVFGDLVLYLWSILYLSHNVGTMYWGLHAKFHKNPSSINGCHGQTRTHAHVICLVIGISYSPCCPCLHRVYHGVCTHRTKHAHNCNCALNSCVVIAIYVWTMVYAPLFTQKVITLCLYLITHHPSQVHNCLQDGH